MVLFCGVPSLQDCVCLEACRYCALVYDLDVRCLEGEMNVTSDHLTLCPPEEWDTNRMDEQDNAEEMLAKRGPQFGIPAGPGT